MKAEEFKGQFKSQGRSTMKLSIPRLRPDSKRQCLALKANNL